MSRRVMLLQLLLLSAYSPGLLASPFDSYIVNPASYLDVVRSPTSRKGHSAAGADAPSCNSDSSTAACAQHPPTRHLLEPISAREPTADLSTSPTSSSSSSVEALVAATRGLQQAANPARLLPPYNVCVSSWAPMVRCTPGADQSKFQGYQIELFRMAASEVGWAESDFVFTCMDYTVMMADLNNPTGNCTVVATGVDVSPDNLAAGLKFSWPTYKSGLRVMIHTHLQTGSTWAFSEIFRWEVWLMLGATGIAVGLLVAFLEVINRTELPNPFSTDGGGKITSKKTWQSWQWYSLAKIVHVVPHVGDPGSDASRVLVLGYGFLVLVMVSMYTAVAASRITAAALVHPVHSVEDLAGGNNPYTALTWQEYVPALLERHGVHALGTPWEREGDLQGMVQDLRAGKYSALVLDAPVLEYISGTNEDCDLFLVGDVFESFSLALAFPPAAADAMVFDFSKAIVSLQTYQGALDMLENVYIKTGGTSKCFGSDSGGHGSGETIALEQVSGLWYILLMTTGLCMILTLAHNVRKDPQKMAKVRRLSSFLGSSAGRRSATGAADGTTNPGDPNHGQGSGVGHETKVEAFTAPPGSEPTSWAGLQQQQQQQQQPKPSARAPSALQMFIGTSFAQRHEESDEDSEVSSPTSPKKMHLPHRLSQQGLQ